MHSVGELIDYFVKYIFPRFLIMVLYQLISHCIHFLHLIGTVFFSVYKIWLFVKKEFSPQSNWFMSVTTTVVLISASVIFSWLSSTFCLQKQFTNNYFFKIFVTHISVTVGSQHPTLPAQHINTNNKQTM